MQKIIEAYIKDEAKKHIDKYHKYHNSLNIEYKRIQNRLLQYDPKEIKKPSYWETDKKFNPFYVYSNKKAIARSIAKKLKYNEYKPNSTEKIYKQKKDGSKREISIYQIPDAAVSNYFYKRLLNKNKHRFSSFSYAYRDDRNVHFAIQDIAIELKKNSRIFVAEFDFSKFFDTINHSFLLSQLDENGFLITKEEKEIIKSFLNDDKGIPQGTSLSLFLANVVCWRLDRELEDAGLRFARFADDTLIWSKDYTKILKTIEIMNDFSKLAGVEINYKKSEGISLLTSSEIPSEFVKSKESIEFLGYQISSKYIGIKEDSILKIKDRITSILYQNLIFPIKKETLNLKNIPVDKDKDYLTAITQIRRYLYGDLTEEKISNYLSGKYKRVIFKGIMSFYLLIDDEDQLKKLDKWLCRTIVNTIKLRKKLLQKHEVNVSCFPYNLNYQNIISSSSEILHEEKRLFKIPSFLRIKKAIKKGIEEQGIVKIMNPKVDLYNY
ncbi:MAG: reverse transcriptase domain-containing protein [Psychrilyobacter sp.]|uniref:reverse transcriptase domain-containing protein n=1 Tax=Psychrilyobacter sp. TaxID=2586924 RepID=UPI003C743A22